MIGDEIDVEEHRAGNMRPEIIVLRQGQNAGQLEGGIENPDLGIVQMRGKPVRGDERIVGRCHGAKSPMQLLVVIAGLDPAIHLLEEMDTRVKPARERQPFIFGSHFSTGPPASRQAAKPPPIWATSLIPMSCAVLAASAERRPPAQWKMNFLSSWKIGLA